MFGLGLGLKAKIFDLGLEAHGPVLGLATQGLGLSVNGLGLVPRGLVNIAENFTCTTSCLTSTAAVLYFYPRDAMLARVFAIATCPDVCLSVCLSVRTSVRHTPVLCLAERKQDREMYTTI